jgi:hypothetical protein
MKSAQLLNSALFLLVVSVSAPAHAQGGQGKKSDPSPQGKGAPTDRRTQTPAPDNGRQAQRPAPAPDNGRQAQRPAPAQSNRRAAAQAPRPTPTQASRPAQNRVARTSPAPAAQQRQQVQASAAPARGRTVARPAPVQMARPVPVPAAAQSQRAQAEQQRATQYRPRLDQQVRLGQQRSAQLQQQKHLAQYRAQQQYLAQLRAQQLRLQTARNYSNDPYVRAAPMYRYAYSGYNRETNQYGADLLRQAVNDGYQEGVRFGQADRQDGLSPNFQNNYAYQDANYGYAGNYVDQSDYNYYFRQGFQRGYNDGYYSRSQYGNGSSSILANLLTTILGLTSLR